MRIASVNQDAGVAPGRSKGAAVHLQAMREAFEGLGHQVICFDEPNAAMLHEGLETNHATISFDFVYERYSHGKDGAARFAGRHGLPLVLEVNAPLAAEQSLFRNRQETPQERATDRLMFETASLVLAVSSAVADYAVSRGARPDRVAVCPNGVDDRLFNLDVRSAATRIDSIPDEATVLGFHGRERPWHGFDLLTQAFSALLDRGHDVHFLVIGHGDFEPLGSLPPRTFTRLDWQPHASIPRLLGNVDVLPVVHRPEFPYYFSPLKLAEAMACGVVPVVPDTGDLGSTVLDGETGYVYPAGDLDAGIAAMERLCADPEIRRQMAAAAAGSSSVRGWSAIAEQVLDAMVAEGTLPLGPVK